MILKRRSQPIAASLKLRPASAAAGSADRAGTTATDASSTKSRGCERSTTSDCRSR